jgi:cytidylate kinase
MRGGFGPGATPQPQATLSHWPFITISRQAGAGGRTIGRLLAARLNTSAAEGTADHPWQCLDRELVERIAADHHLSTDLIRSLEHSSHTWITEFFSGLSREDNNPSELSVFHRVVETVRALARAGHVILIGQGSVFITRDMPRGLHVRIVAPLEWRVRNFARLENLSETEARKRVLVLDGQRQAFVNRFWPGTTLNVEQFHATLNAGLLSDQQIAAALLPLVENAAEGA